MTVRELRGGAEGACFVDSAPAAALLRVDGPGVLRDGDLLGRLLDTFVASQLRAELPVARSRPRLYHVREAHGRHEIDLLAELGGGNVVAREVKATASPGLASVTTTPSCLRGLTDPSTGGCSQRANGRRSVRHAGHITTSSARGSRRRRSSGSLVAIRWWRDRAQRTSEASTTSSAPATPRS